MSARCSGGCDCNHKEEGCGDGHEAVQHAQECTKDLMVDQWSEWVMNSSKFNDNRGQLYRLFFFEIDPKHAGGYVWRCHTCADREGFAPCTRVTEKWFECKNAIVPTSVKCPRCGTKWRLEIDLSVQKQCAEDMLVMN